MFAATQAEIARALNAPLLPFMAVHNVSASLLLMASPGKVEMAVQLVPEGKAQRRWVQQSVLAVDLAAVALMGLLNLVGQSVNIMQKGALQVLCPSRNKPAERLGAYVTALMVLNSGFFHSPDSSTWRRCSTAFHTSSKPTYSGVKPKRRMSLCFLGLPPSPLRKSPITPRAISA